MTKIAWLGAGSTVFGEILLGDILSYPELEDSHVGLMDINEERLGHTAELARCMIDNGDVPATVESTTDRESVLDGADYVVSTIDVGGLSALENEITIPAEYGVEIASGGTLNPSGVFHALRNIPTLIEIAEDMERLCPDAPLLNHTNPMAPICWAIDEATDVDVYGICHSVPNTSGAIAEYAGVPADELEYVVAGINHLSWFVEATHDGESVYPRIHEAMEDPEVFDQDAVRFEVMRHFGAFPTESSRHVSEYLPYFRTDETVIEEFDVPSGWWLRQKRVSREDTHEFDPDAVEPERSNEYTARLVHSMETGQPRRLNLNVRNRTGAIGNLPNESCVEVPCLVDGTGVQPVAVGDLPPQLAALTQSNVNVQERVVTAALERDREALFQAVKLDPLTAATLSLAEIHDLTNDLLEANAEYLPELSA